MTAALGELSALAGELATPGRVAAECWSAGLQAALGALLLIAFVAACVVLVRKAGQGIDCMWLAVLAAFAALFALVVLACGLWQLSEWLSDPAGAMARELAGAFKRIY